MDEANEKLEKVLRGLKTINLTVEAPIELLVEVDALDAFIKDLQQAEQESFDVVIVQPITFTDARFIRKVVELISAPILIWSVREPYANGGRLCLNSLTGANLYAQELRPLRQFALVHGDPGEEDVLIDVRRKCLALGLSGNLAKQTVLALGEAPDGFFFSDISVLEIAHLGIKFKNLPLNSVFEASKRLEDTEIMAEKEFIRNRIEGVAEDTPELLSSAKILRVVRQMIQEQGASLVTTRCWPDYFTQAGVAPCSIVSLLNDEGIPTSCERDVLGAISMYMLAKLSNQPAFLGDLVHLDDKLNTLTFWHCGAGAPSLAGRSGAKAGVHPNRKIGISLEMEAKSGPVTVIRLGLDAGKLRLLIMEGWAKDGPQKFLGTCIDVVPGEISGRGWMNKVMTLGYEPHYAVGYGHWADVLKEWGSLIGIEVNCSEPKGEERSSLN